MAVTNYTLGTSVNGAFDDTTGVLTITGNGEMDDYSNGESPVYGIRLLVATIIIESGVTKIGNYLFIGFSNLSSVTLPEGLLTIGASAFKDCIKLESITFPNSVTTMGTSTYPPFAGSGLITAFFNEGITKIPDYTFRGASHLTNIVIPSTVATIGTNAFRECTALNNIINKYIGNQTIGSYAFNDNTASNKTAQASEANTNFKSAVQAQGYTVTPLSLGTVFVTFFVAI